MFHKIDHRNRSTATKNRIGNDRTISFEKKHNQNNLRISNTTDRINSFIRQRIESRQQSTLIDCQLRNDA